MRIAQLDRSELAAARRVLATACAFDRAADVAEETLFAPGPTAAAQPLGAWIDNALVGVASTSSRWLRVLAVNPSVRRRGVGSALLEACERAARGVGEARLRTLDQPGNYLAPGVDARNTEAIEWLERRGWVRAADLRTNVLIAVQGNAQVSEERAIDAAIALTARGYEVRRARADEHALLDAVAREFGGAWPWELARALEFSPPGVHVAMHDGEYCAFAAHDGNNRGLGWFGPTGTWPAHRGQGLGEALLLACLVDVGTQHPRCEVAWIGPRAFYDKVAGIAEDRHFVLLARDL